MKKSDLFLMFAVSAFVATTLSGYALKIDWLYWFGLVGIAILWMIFSGIPESKNDPKK